MAVDVYINALPPAQRNALLRLPKFFNSQFPITDETHINVRGFEQNTSAMSEVKWPKAAICAKTNPSLAEYSN